jgi:hypothetical protein
LSGNARRNLSLAGIRVIERDKVKSGSNIRPELPMIPDRTQISDEVSRLIALQTEFYKKSDPTPEQVQEFEWAGRRIRILFAELAQGRAA